MPQGDAMGHIIKRKRKRASKRSDGERLTKMSKANRFKV